MFPRLAATGPGSGRRAGAGSLALLLLLLSGSPAHASEAEKLEQIRDRISELQSDLVQEKRTKAQLYRALKLADREIDRAGRQLRRTRAELERQRQALAGIRQRIAALEEELTRRRQQLAGYLRAGYGIGQQPALKLLLNQDDPALAGRMLTYYRYFSEAQLKAIAATREAREALAEAERERLEATERLAETEREQQAQRDRLAEARKERQRLLAELDRRIETKEQRLKALREDERRLSRLLEDLEQQAARRLFEGKSLGQLKGRLKWPTKGRILHRFGSRRGIGDLRWQGVLIGGREGQEIRAIAPGKVVFADWLRGYGMTLIIDHGHGYMSIYSHNQSLYKTLHETVEGRELIATMGVSPSAHRSALYFEIRRRGKPVNPARWCR